MPENNSQQTRQPSFAAGVTLGITSTLLVGIAVWLTIAYSGFYNVAATDPHADPVRWTFDTTMHRSVSKRADDDAVPANPSRDVIARGAAHYAHACVHCHGAPGQDPADWSRGMRPEPPHLTEAAAEWSPNEIHWIVGNGVKMTGMPAFSPHYSEEEIVALAAFVAALPGLTAADYTALAGSGNADSH
jgi:mono/diheme cytochrome c family protein